MRTQDIEEKKTDVAAALLRHGGLTVISHPRSFHEFQKEHGYNQELLITPVDSEFGRRKLATGLPKMVLNAATNGTNVTLSRHGFADGKACLHCLYLPKVEETTTEKRLAIDMGLAVDEVESLIAANEGISEDLVRRVEKNLGFETGKFQAWVGKHVTVHGQTSSVGQDCPVRWSRTAL
jgi:hypothetical protein